MATMADLLSSNTTQSQMSSFFIDKMGLISVKSYDATGDGVTNDTTEILACATAATAAGLSAIFFPHGTYVVDSGTASSLAGFYLWGDNSTITGDTITVNNMGTNYYGASVKTYGALGDGVQVDTTYIQAACDAIATTGGVVSFPDEGTYLVDEEITVASNITIDLRGSTIQQISTIDASTPVFSSTGNEEAEYALTSVTANVAVLTTSNPDYFVIGDLVRIGSEDIVDSYNTALQFGELAYITDVSGTSITLDNLYFSSYYSTSPTISKINPNTNITIKNGVLDCDEATNLTYGITFNKVTGATIENVKIVGAGYVHVNLIDCVNVQIERSIFDKATAPTLAYGISFRDGTMRCGARYNQFKRMRHSLSTNTTGSAKGITKDITFEHNHVSQMTGGAIDTHSNTYNVNILHNVVEESSIDSGINFEGIKGIIQGNKIYGALVGISVHNETDIAGEIEISDNDIYDADGRGIKLSPPVRGALSNYRNAIIEDNKVIRCGAEAIVVNVNGFTDNIKRLRISDNIIEMSVADEAMIIRDSENVNFSNNVIEGLHTSYNLDFRDCSIMSINGNTINNEVTGGRGMLFMTCSKVTILGNVYANTLSPVNPIATDSACSNIYARCNYLDGTVSSAGTNVDLGTNGL